VWLFIQALDARCRWRAGSARARLLGEMVDFRGCWLGWALESRAPDLALVLDYRMPSARRRFLDLAESIHFCWCLPPLTAVGVAVAVSCHEVDHHE
jgi:hypothetical protein